MFCRAPGQPDPIFQPKTLSPSCMARSRSFWDTSIATPPSRSVPRGSDGAARDTGDGCFCHQRHLPRMIVPGSADHDPGPGIEGMGRGALLGAGRTRRAVTGVTPRRGPAFTKPPGASSPGCASQASMPTIEPAECRRGTGVKVARPLRRPCWCPPAGPRHFGLGGRDTLAELMYAWMLPPAASHSPSASWGPS
jgi:hypothetical protein